MSTKKERNTGTLWSYALIWVVLIGIFGFLYFLVRQAIVNEVRGHAMGVAIALAESIDVRDLDQIRTPEDMGKPAYERIQGLLGRVADANPDIRYAYTMRRSKQGGGTPWDFEYIVDQAEQDENFNGRIDPEEESKPPGVHFDGSGFPDMADGWLEPAADRDVAPDPPYGMLLSGYAPVRDDKGVTRAMVGADVVSKTIAKKLVVLKIAIAGMTLLLGLLLSGMAFMYFRQRRLYEKIRRLTTELAQGNKDLVDATRGFVQPQTEARKGSLE